MDTLREPVGQPGCWSVPLFVVAAVAAGFLAWRGNAAGRPVVIDGMAVPPLPTLAAPRGGAGPGAVYRALAGAPRRQPLRRAQLEDSAA